MSRSNDEQRAEAAARPHDVIAAILEDHADIKSMMNDVETAGGRRDEAFRRLVAKLAVHETAEEEVVHPLAKRAPDGEQIVEHRLEEESKGKAALAELESMGVDAPEFDERFRNVCEEILRHAEHEEQEELPGLEREVDEGQLERAASMFRAAQKVAPTHAHAHSPESALGNLTIGPFVAMADRARDAVHEAMHGPSI